MGVRMVSFVKNRSDRSLSHRHPVILLLAFLFAVFSLGLIVALYMGTPHTGKRSRRSINTYVIPAGMKLAPAEVSPALMTTPAAAPAPAGAIVTDNRWHDWLVAAAFIITGAVVAAALALLVSNPHILRLT
jgi:hypothetical protein